MNAEKKSKEREKLEKKLRKIWQNEEFVQGVICNAKNRENWETISEFIDMSYRMGDEPTSDNIVALSVILSGEDDGKR